METNHQPTDNPAYFLPFVKRAAQDAWRAWPLFIILALGSDASQRVAFDRLWEWTICYQSSPDRLGNCPNGLTVLAAPGPYWLAMTLGVFVAYLWWRAIAYGAMPYRVLLTALAFVAIATVLVARGVSASPELGIIAAVLSLLFLRMLVPWWKAADKQMREAATSPE